LEMKLLAKDFEAIRTVLGQLDPKSSATASQPLSLEELYTPPTHGLALDINRPLVVGNRGVGKSVWSGVLADEQTRSAIDQLYPKLGLSKMRVQLGFHEAAGKVEGVAPSTAVLKRLLEQQRQPEEIWNSVLLRAVAPFLKYSLPRSLEQTIDWAAANVEEHETVLRKADKFLHDRGETFLLVFDALDRLGSSWSEIRPLTEGVLRLSLAMTGYRALRAKVFMRTDQSKDETVFKFPDASKLRAGRVELAWHSTELYGLLFKNLHKNPLSASSFKSLLKAAHISRYDPSGFTGKEDQRAVFSLIAGEYMGSDHRRGRTYTWLIDHLADAFGETTPRSFLITLQRAANSHNKPHATAIDHHGIREGVQDASRVRVDQLEEDFPWIRTVLDDLSGLEVPCTPDVFKRRWRDEDTAAQVREVTRNAGLAGPIELERSTRDTEGALLEALKNIGVVEERAELRINMPDIFRVAAKIKRRGGVRPPSSANR
jgi:hypothetical protein